jgi:excisionase family DNA binding protein
MAELSCSVRRTFGNSRRGTVASNYMTPAEIADIMGVATNTARGIIRAQIPHLKIGQGRLLVKISDFEEWLEQVTITPDGKAQPRQRPYNTDEDDRREFHRRRKS